MKTYDYENSMTVAEEACMIHLCGKLGYTAGQNAFFATNPGVADCIVFDIGQCSTGDLNTWRAGYAHMRAQMEIYDRNRKRLQQTIMRLMKEMPTCPAHGDDFLVDGSNVVQFRLAPNDGNPGGIKTTEIEQRTDKEAVPVYVCSVLFDVVFECTRG